MHKFLIAAALVSATAIPAFAGANVASSASVNQTTTAVARPSTPVSVPSRPSIPSLPSVPSTPVARR